MIKIWPCLFLFLLTASCFASPPTWDEEGNSDNSQGEEQRLEVAERNNQASSSAGNDSELVERGNPAQLLATESPAAPAGQVEGSTWYRVAKNPIAAILSNSDPSIADVQKKFEMFKQTSQESIAAMLALIGTQRPEGAFLDELSRMHTRATEAKWESLQQRELHMSSREIVGAIVKAQSCMIESLNEENSDVARRLSRKIAEQSKTRAETAMQLNELNPQDPNFSKWSIRLLCIYNLTSSYSYERAKSYIIAASDDGILDDIERNKIISVYEEDGDANAEAIADRKKLPMEIAWTTHQAERDIREIQLRGDLFNIWRMRYGVMNQGFLGGLGLDILNNRK